MSQQNAVTVDGTPEVGQIEVRDLGIEVLNAPKRAQISLSLLFTGRLRGVFLSSNWIIFGTGPTTVAYKAVGVNEEGTALILERLHDHRHDG